MIFDEGGGVIKQEKVLYNKWNRTKPSWKTSGRFLNLISDCCENIPLEKVRASIKLAVKPPNIFTSPLGESPHPRNFILLNNDKKKKVTQNCFLKKFVDIFFLGKLSVWRI